MSAAETVAAYIANANNARRDGAAYMAQEWERVADELARAAYGMDARALMGIRASVAATATVERRAE